jgi:hypothetical protein
MRGALIIAVIAVVAFTAADVNARRRYTTYGVGIESCGKWLENRRNRPVDWSMQIQWVLGFVSAAGYHGSDMKQSDYAAMASWIDNYCTANPLNDIDDATKSLIKALQVK